MSDVRELERRFERGAAVLGAVEATTEAAKALRAAVTAVAALPVNPRTTRAAALVAEAAEFIAGVSPGALVTKGGR
jgi:hypothetical protein